MNDYSGQYGNPSSLDVSINAGLRSFMLGVYNKMAMGLVVSAMLAYAFGTIPALTAILVDPTVFMVLRWGPLVLLLGSNFFMRNPSPTASALLYWAVVAMLGTSLAIWVMIADQQLELSRMTGGTITSSFSTIGMAFMITAAAFAGLSLYGYTTKRNISGMHSAIVMMSWGMLPLVGIGVFWLKSSAIELGLMVVMLGIYSALIATQTQTLKLQYASVAGDQRSQAVLTNSGALNLYIAFVSIFQILLSLMGGSRD